MAELADDWPSLAPIRTSCSTSSSSGFISSSGSYPLSQAPRSTEHHHHHTFQSPPSSSSSSSHVMGFLHASSSSTAKGGHSLLSKCLPPRPINATPKGFPRQCAMNGSPAGRVRQGGGERCGGARADAFRSYASFPGAQGLIYSTAAAAVAAASSSSRSGPLHSNGACKNQLIALNAFTMIPAAVVGKKKPPDYHSDEPTSPEVTCIGRVRRSKNSACNWDALVNGSEKLCKKKKKKPSRQQIEVHHARRGDMDLQLAASIPRPLCMDPSNGPRVPKWKKIISLFEDLRDLHTPYLQMKLRQEDWMINLDRLRPRTRHTATVLQCDENDIGEREAEINACNAGVVLQSLCQSGEEEGEENGVDAAVQEADGGNNDCTGVHGAAHVPAPVLLPPNACLLLMRNKSGRNKVFHDDDDNGGAATAADNIDGNINSSLVVAHLPPLTPALKASTPPNCAGHPIQKWNRKQALSFWKSKKLSSTFIKAFGTK